MAAKKSKRDIERRRSSAAKRRIDAFHRREAARRGGVNPTSSFVLFQKTEWILDWNCVMFKQGYVVIYARSDMSIKFKPTQVNAPKSIEAFNYLKKYLNKRLPPVRCSIVGQKLTVIDEIDFSKAIQQFGIAARQGLIKVNRTKSSNMISPSPMSFSQALSKAQQMTLEEFKKYKSKYIDYLVELQCEDYKVIPCVERLAHSTGDMTEYAFLFSLKCGNGNIMIVHENVNPDRSTLIFEVESVTYNNSIRALYDFLQSAEINKRSNLRERNIEIDEVGVVRYRSINHDNIYQWQRTIKSCVLYNWAMNIY